MNIYRISQDKNIDYDTYDSAVVVAKDEDEAAGIHPSGGELRQDPYSDWVPTKEYVTVELIGKATKEHKIKGVIVASFNAG